MSLIVEAKHCLGDFRLDASFTSEGGLTALFGQSGAGKSSLVNIISGLVRPDRGRVIVNGEVLLDTAQQIFVPRHRRRIGYVFQEDRLFPHLTVRQNLLYGHWFTARADRYESLDHVVDLLGIAHLLGRKPARLSGGEKQRVAIGRALLASPRLLLMDEPLASLDDTRKAEILPYIERLRDETKIPIVYVSHSVPEVTRLATTVVVMADGKVTGAGSVQEVISQTSLFPMTGRAEAGAVIEAKVIGHDDDYQLTQLECGAGILTVSRLDMAIGMPVRIRVRAGDIMLALSPHEGLSALNVLPAVIREIGEIKGPSIDIGLDCGGEMLTARLTRASADKLKLRPGAEIYAVIKSIAFDNENLSRPPNP
ncbi:molybdenum ABC transporter ATP-binding protein [Parasphingorhabdus sp.]|uniref:molybdenum ABC transporter ATP-binding protein n=1 Tax=Parasphingorhabdus sp. TaxID=2709688 RepID=UPI002F935FCA